MTTSTTLHTAARRISELAREAPPPTAEACAALLELDSTHAAIEAALLDVLSRDGISCIGFGLLVLLDRPTETMPGTGELAGELGISASATSEALARLEMAGLLTRRRRPENRRHNCITLTAAGHTATRRYLRHLLATMRKIAAPLSPRELNSLQQFCSRLHPSSFSQDHS